MTVKIIPPAQKAKPFAAPVRHGLDKPELPADIADVFKRPLNYRPDLVSPDDEGEK